VTDDEWDESAEVTYVGTPSTLIDKNHRGEFRGNLLVLAGSNSGEMLVLDRNETTLGRAEECTIQILDSGVSRQHCRLSREKLHFFIEDLGSRNGTYVNGRRISSKTELQDGDKVQLGRTTILRFSLQDALDENFQKQLIDSALRDGMTKAYNRRYFLDRLDAEYRFSTRHDQPLALLLLDIDHFKKINDTYGHLAGDEALSRFATAIKAEKRNEDVFARYGGEEFAVICRSISLEGARIFAERLRAAVEKMTIEHDGKTFSMTVSIGIAAIPDHGFRDSVELLDAADRALYAAKHGGRNRVELYQAKPPTEDIDDDTLD